jgi:hypothetical protein
VLGPGTCGRADLVDVSLENAATAPRNMRQINDERSSDFIGEALLFFLFGTLFFALLVVRFVVDDNAQ